MLSTLLGIAPLAIKEEIGSNHSKRVPKREEFMIAVEPENSITDAEEDTEPRARVLLIDDHPMVRNGLLRLIGQKQDLVCCGEAGNAAEAQAAVERLKPDLAILDLRLKNADGIDLIKTLKSLHPGLRILILSQYGAPLYVERALHAGAMGF